MKKIIPFILAAVFFTAVSCDRTRSLSDDPLNQYPADPAEEMFQLLRIQAGSDTVLHVSYDNLLMRSVAYDSGRLTKVFDNAQKIYRFDYNGIHAQDSVALSQYLTWSGQQISAIGEQKRTWDLSAPNTQAKKKKTMYTLNYDAEGNLTKVMAKSGQEIPLQEFVYTSYRQAELHYTGKNVTLLKWSEGVLDASQNPVPATDTLKIGFDGYDDKKSPYSLLPYAYKIHYLITVNPAEAHVFSLNNPKRITLLNQFTGNVILGETVYTYNEKHFPTFGFGKQFYYRTL